MTAEIITLPDRNKGNGAREALIEIGEDCPFHVPSDVAMHWADDVLAKLWLAGFVIVPVAAESPEDDYVPNENSWPTLADVWRKLNLGDDKD